MSLIITPRRDEQSGGAVDMGRHQGFVARGVPLQHGDPALGGSVKRGLIVVDDHDAACRGASLQQLFERLVVADAEARDEDMVTKVFLNEYSSATCSRSV